MRASCEIGRGAAPPEETRPPRTGWFVPGWLFGIFYGSVQAFFFFDRFNVIKNVYRLPAGAHRAVFSLVMVFSCGVVGALAGLAAGLLAPRAARRPPLSRFLLAAAVAAFGYVKAALYLNADVFAFEWGLRVFFRGRELRAALFNPAVIAENLALLCAACAAGALLHRLLLRARSRGERIALSAAFFCFAILCVPVNCRLPRLANPASWAGNAALAAACACLGWAFSRFVRGEAPRRLRGVATAWVLSFPLVLFAWRDRESKALMICRGPAPVRAVIRATDALFDLDRDGFSPLTPVGDCDNRDRSINPLAADIPGNGVDEDCWGGDFTFEQLARRQGEDERRRAHNLASAHDAAALREACGGAGRPSIFLICVDAMRSDHVSLNGYPRRTTPRLDALLRRAAYFPRCITPSCSTQASMPGILTSRYRIEPGGAPPIQSLLRRAGYRTAAFQSVTDPGGHFEAIEREGFDSFFSPNQVGQYRIHNDELNERVMGFVSREKGKAPLFVLAVYGDTHGSYYAPPPFSGLFGAGGGFQTAIIPTAEEVREMERGYDRALAYTDRMLAELLSRLDAAGAAEGAVVVITSDHGEEFYEHGGLFHVTGVHAEVTTVPLAFLLPAGVSQGTRYDAAVQSLDIMPTLLPLAGVAVPDGVRGWSLAPSLAGTAPPPERTILVEAAFGPTHYVLGLVQHDWKLIRNFYSGTTALFDIGRDPGERADRAADRPDVASRMTLDLCNLKSYLMLPGGGKTGGGGV